MKRLFSILLSIAILCTLTSSAFAADAVTDSTDDIAVAAFSPEFPDAYLEYGGPAPALQSSSVPSESPLGTITVTAFCAEAYNPETGEVLYSRLMNKEEVADWRAAGSPTEPTLTSTSSDAAIETRGELKLTLAVYPYADGGVSEYNTNLVARGQADWLKGPSWGAGVTRPSWGRDIIGISWTKGLDAFNREATATSNNGDDVDISLCEWDDTEFVSWEFIEQFGPHIGSIGGPDWAESIECSTGLGVPPSVYYQKADIALTYAHSYSDVVIDDVSVSVGVSKDGPEAGLDISFGAEANEWTIIAIVDGVDL